MRYKNIVIAHHSNTLSSLVEEELLNYILDKSNKIYYVTHPFKNSRDDMPLSTNLRIYKNGKKQKSFYSLSARGPEVLFFIKDLLFNIFFFINKEKTDIFFGVDNLNAFSGIILRKMGKVEKVVYYVIDYVPNRFNNSLLNKIYNKIDEICVKYSDQTWNLSDQMAIEREKRGLSKKYLNNQITVPVGCNPLKTNTKVRKNLLVFLGILSKDQGIENLIKAMPKILNENSDVKLRIIGSGNEMERIKKLSKYLDIDKSVEFLGFIKENKEVDKLLQECRVGIAPYLLSKNSFKYYTDPGKIKTYLGAGLPIVMSDISNIAKVIRDRKAGIIINDKIDEIAQAVNSIFSNVREYDKLQKNAFALSKEYSWKNIFNKAFESLEKNV